MPLVEVLCLNGHRVKVTVNPNTKLNEVLEEACQKHNFLPVTDYYLIHNKKEIDLTISFRFSSLINHSKLEMRAKQKSDAEKREERAAREFARSAMISLTVKTADQKRTLRCTTLFPFTNSLLEVLQKFCQIYPEFRDFILPATSEPSLISPVLQFSDKKFVGHEMLANHKLASLLIGADESSTTTTVDAHFEVSNVIVPLSSAPPAVPAPSSMTSPSIFAAPPMQSMFEYGEERSRSDAQNRTPNQNHAPQHLPRQSPPSSSSLGQLLGIDLSTLSSAQNRFTAVQSNCAAISHSQQPSNAAQQQEAQIGFATELTNQNQPVTANVEEPRCDRERVLLDMEEIAQIKRARIRAEQPAEGEGGLFDDENDAFYEVTEADCHVMMKSYQQEKVRFESEYLMTRRMRDAAKHSNFSRYPRCIIQFQLGGEAHLVVQSCFLPCECVRRLYEEVRAFLAQYFAIDLATDFYLYTTPPKQRLSNLNADLISADLVPLAKVFIDFSANQQLARCITRDNLMRCAGQLMSTDNKEESATSVTQYDFICKQNCINAQQIVEKWMSASQSETSNSTCASTNTNFDPEKRQEKLKQLEKKMGNFLKKGQK